MGKLKMGYVGCGFMAQSVHIPNILLLDDCELVAVAEVREELGHKVQRRFGIPGYVHDHLALAADDQIEAVAVSGHFAMQGEIAIDLLRAGKHVFMEKPMAVSVEQGERMLEAQKASGKSLMIGYMKRYDAGNRAVKAEIDRMRESGDFGDITMVRNHGFCGNWTGGNDARVDQSDEAIPAPKTRKPDWMSEEHYRPYIGYLQQYTHNINLMRWFLGAGAVTVKHVDLDANGMNGLVIFDIDGVRAVLESGSLSHHAWDEHTQVYFQKGWLRTNAPPLLLKNACASAELYDGRDGGRTTEIFPANGWTWSYKEEMRHFVQCVREGRPVDSPASDSMHDVRAFEEIYRQFIEG